MGRYTESGSSQWVIPKQHCKNAYLALDFIDDEDASDVENLKDCLADINFKVVKAKSTTESMVFRLDDSNEDVDFDWSIMQALVDFLEEGSFLEEIHVDENLMLVGTVQSIDGKKHLVRDYYQLNINKRDQFARGKFVRHFDTDLELE